MRSDAVLFARYAYDERGKLSRVTDPTNASYHYAYQGDREAIREAFGTLNAIARSRIEG